MEILIPVIVLLAAGVLCALLLTVASILFGVKEDRSYLEKNDNTTLKDLFGALVHNDQLMVTALSMVLFMIGYCTTTGLGYQYFEYVYQDTGVYMVFAAVLAVAQLTALSLFPVFSKRFTRKQLYTGAMIAITVSYLLFFLSFEILPIIVIAGLGLFFGQAFIQLLMLLFLADAVEYGEWKTGRRNEAASFAVQPFINQFGGAASKGIVSLALFFSGVTMMLNEFDAYLVENGITDSLISESIKKDFIANLPDHAGWVIKLFMMILPLICILASFIIYSKKFKIDEKFYAQIIKDLEERNDNNNKK
jgi:melibiose permease/lactose/raffinose/galactose permease